MRGESKVGFNDRVSHVSVFRKTPRWRERRDAAAGGEGRRREEKGALNGPSDSLLHSKTSPSD